MTLHTSTDRRRIAVLGLLAGVGSVATWAILPKPENVHLPQAVLTSTLDATDRSVAVRGARAAQGVGSRDQALTPTLSGQNLSESWKRGDVAAEAVSVKLAPTSPTARANEPLTSSQSAYAIANIARFKVTRQLTPAEFEALSKQLPYPIKQEALENALAKSLGIAEARAADLGVTLSPTELQGVTESIALGYKGTEALVTARDLFQRESGLTLDRLSDLSKLTAIQRQQLADAVAARTWADKRDLGASLYPDLLQFTDRMLQNPYLAFSWQQNLPWR